MKIWMGWGPLVPRKIISLEADGIRKIYAADLDNDGDADVLSASSIDDKIAWYENEDGLGSFGPQKIVSTDIDGARSVFASDLDGDGVQDVISASIVDHKIAWYKNLILGVSEYDIERLTIYPNPVSNLLQIQANGQNITSVTVFDVMGKEVITVLDGFQELDFSTMARGLYVLKIETENGITTKKIVKE